MKLHCRTKAKARCFYQERHPKQVSAVFSANIRERNDIPMEPCVYKCTLHANVCRHTATALWLSMFMNKRKLLKARSMHVFHLSLEDELFNCTLTTISNFKAKQKCIAHEKRCLF